MGSLVREDRTFFFYPLLKSPLKRMSGKENIRKTIMKFSRKRI